MSDERFAAWAAHSDEGEEFRCKKDRVYVISCGTKTYTWFVKEGVLFTTLQSEGGGEELANALWQAGDMIHSLDDDIMLPLHAMTDATLVRVPSGDFNREVRADPELSWALAEHYHSRFTKTLERYRRASLEAAEDRLAYFEDLFGQIEELKGTRTSDATLALFMGMHRVSVSRIRKKAGEKPAL